MPVSTGLRPPQLRPPVEGISWPVNKSTGLPAVGAGQLGGGCGGVGGSGQFKLTKPQTPQKRGKPTPGSLATVLPSSLTVPKPAIFHSPVPPMGEPSNHQISTF